MYELPLRGFADSSRLVRFVTRGGALASALALGLACSGAIGGDSTGEPGSSSPGTVPAGGATSAPGSPGSASPGSPGTPAPPGSTAPDPGKTTPPPAAVCPPPGPIRPGPNPLRRLTRDEYNRTVKDLLGDDTKPADAFPPEPLVHGFANNVTTQAVAFTLADDYFKAAEKLATTAIAKLDRLAPCDAATKGEETCARSFIADFGQRVYRRPLPDAERTSLLATYKAGRSGGADHRGGVRMVLTRMLASPHFLYRPELGDPTNRPAPGVLALTSWELATRLSYLLWGTMPDQMLFDAAGGGRLSTDEQIAAQVTRMLGDARAKAGARGFYEGWLLVDTLEAADKDAKIVPGFRKLVPYMVEELSRLVEDVLWRSGAALGELFTADYSFMNPTLAAFMGLRQGGTGTVVERVQLAPTGAPGPAWRAGILTTPGVLAGQAKLVDSSPVLRGKFVAEQILCLEVPLPPADVPLPPEAAGSKLTTRERLTQHAALACASCHRLMDPFGFAFEHYDTAGRFRATESGKPVDASGMLIATDVDGAFQNGLELSARFARSQQVRTCISKQWLRHGLGHLEGDDDVRTLAQLACAMKDERAGFPALVTAFTRTDAFRYLTDGGRR